MSSNESVLPALSQKDSFVMDGFALQYTSLILIILSFVIGAFAGEKLAQQSKSTQVEPETMPTFQLLQGVSSYKEVTLSTLSFTELFNVTSDRPFQEKLIGLIAALKNHDLNLHGTVAIGSNELVSDADRLMLAMRRAVALESVLHEAGIPKDAISLYAVENSREEQVVLEVVRNETQ